MKNIILSLIVICNVGISIGQVLILENLKTCFEGENYWLKTLHEDCEKSNYFIISGKPNTDNHDLYSTFTSYEIIDNKNKSEKLMHVWYNMENWQKTQGVINLSTGKLIIPNEGDQEINYCTEKNVFIINSLYQSSRIIDTQGNAVVIENSSQLIYTSLGFSCIDEEVIDKQIFYNSAGEQVLIIPNFQLQAEIDSNNFLGIFHDTIEDAFFSVIVNRAGEIVFEDQCKDGLIQLVDDSTSITSYLSAFGFCDFGDSKTILIKNKEGEWTMPLAKLSKKSFIAEMIPIVCESNSKVFKGALPAYYIMAENDSYLITSKGKKLVTFQTNYFFYNITFDENFIYGYTTRNAFKVFTIDGKPIIETPVNSIAFLHEDATKNGFYAFENESSIFIYDTKTKKTLEISISEKSFATIETIQQLFTTAD